MSFPRYPKYKDSGVDWLGKVPEHWEVKPLRHISSIKKGRLPGETLPAATTDTDLPYLSMDFLRGESENLSYVAASSKSVLADDGDILILWDGSNAGEFLRAKLGVVSSTVALIEPVNMQRDFLFFACKALERRMKDQTVGMGIPHVSGDELKSCAIPCPDSIEQITIAAFLDQETAKIDALVAEQQRLLELLKEKRQAVISHAVTKGLHVKASMKPSGIEWFDAVPEHWQQGPLKRYWEVIDCKHVTVPFLEEGVPVASVMEVRSFELDLSQALKTSEESFKLLGEGGRQPILGDVIYCRNTANTGTSAVVGTNQKIALGQDVCLIKSSGRNGRYLNYILHSGFMAAQLDTLMVGSTFKRINVAEIRGLLVPCPPKSEQGVIADFLDAEILKFDALTAEAQRAIDLLQERRTALISAAVTGQIDVRNQ